jgi:hypothetical protein
MMVQRSEDKSERKGKNAIGLIIFCHIRPARGLLFRVGFFAEIVSQ